MAKLTLMKEKKQFKLIKTTTIIINNNNKFTVHSFIFTIKISTPFPGFYSNKF